MTSTRFHLGHPEWWWDTSAHTPVFVIQSLNGPGDAGVRVWDATDGATKIVPTERLIALDQAPTLSTHTIATIASATKINEAISRNLLLAPLDVPVLPLPHQIIALQHATIRSPVRLLLADEVGLGKTIEAGLVIRELILRGKVRRVLVVAPKGLVGQWVAEMQTHFDMPFDLLLPSDFATHHRIPGDANLWRRFDRVVTAMDSVKPLAAREGWSAQRVARFNRDRFEALTSAGWDLIVVDEAHRLAGSTDGVARFALGQGLAKAAPNLLLLSATPHSGKSDAFHRLVSLLDDRAFPDRSSVTRSRIRPYVVRSEKRSAVNADGKPLFVPRTTRTVPVRWGAAHQDEEALYEAVTEYVRDGYNRAVRERRYAVGFLMILFQRLVTSSTHAIRVALERRLTALGVASIPVSVQDEDGEPSIDEVLAQAPPIAPTEKNDVRALIALADRVEARRADAKAESLLELVQALEQEELDPQLKVLVFTEFTATQSMLADFFSARGYSVTQLNGSMDLDERRRVQNDFAHEARMLISTEAGGEGLNLQFCHIAVNYDLPWNPMRIEQRIGRVDRIGQQRPVRAFNLSLEASIEHRMREILERKLNQILTDLGVDKLGDVLDSSEIEADFDQAYVTSLLHPDTVERNAAALAEGLDRRARETHAAAALLRSEESSDLSASRAVLSHPLPRWVEIMTLNAVRQEGGSVVSRLTGYDITWADGEHWSGVGFQRTNRNLDTTRLITLAEPKLQALLTRGWRHINGLPIARYAIPGLIAGVGGFWSLWQLTVTASSRTYRRHFPLFLHDDGRVLVPSAQHIWETLLRLDTDIRLCGEASMPEKVTIWERLEKAAYAEAADFFDEIATAHRAWIAEEREKNAISFAARRRQAEQVGLVGVREHRLDQVSVDEQRATATFAEAEHLVSEVSALLLVHIEPANG